MTITRNGKNTGPGRPRTTASSRANTRMNASAMSMILTLSRNPLATDGNAPFRCPQSKNRSRITGVPGAVSTTATMMVKKTTVLTEEITTPRRSPNIRARLVP